MLLVGLAACGREPIVDRASESLDPAGKLVIYTVNYPLAYFAERIGGELVDVHFPAPASEDPAFWSPDTDTIAAYQAADLILLNGAGYAKWVDRSALPTSRLVTTSDGFTDRLLPVEGTVTHSHGPEGEHEHGGYAFTTWLDPELAIRQARMIAAAIALERPEREPEIQQRMDALSKDLVNLDSRLGVAAETIDDEPLLFSHPVYQYLINRYKLSAVELHWEPDEVPDNHAWDHLDEMLETHPAKWMLWEGEPLETIVRGLEERGISSLVFDPCGNRADGGDYLDIMATNAAAMETIAGSIR
jgi:zinc transport system substrate-binding protein